MSMTSSAETSVSYGFASMAMASLDAEVHTLIDGGASRICDIGAGANPVIPASEVERLSLDYVIADASTTELAKAPTGCAACVLDVTDTAAVDHFATERGPFDVVLSRWTAEHVPDGHTFHGHVHRLLRAGGVAVHLFPTLYSPVFLVNRALPHALTASIVPHVDQSGREAGGTHESFRPYYSWCRGPTARQLRRLIDLGFVVRHYVGFFGHPYYARLGPVLALHEALSRWLVAHPVPWLTSYALVVLERR